MQPALLQTEKWWFHRHPLSTCVVWWGTQGSKHDGMLALPLGECPTENHFAKAPAVGIRGGCITSQSWEGCQFCLERSAGTPQPSSDHEELLACLSQIFSSIFYVLTYMFEYISCEGTCRVFYECWTRNSDNHLPTGSVPNLTFVF